MRTLIHKGLTICPEVDDLITVQDFRQRQNKDALADFLSGATVEFDGKKYGVTEEDQNEMQAMIMQYQMLSEAGIETQLEWHAKHEECTPFSVEKMVQLVALVKNFVLPHMSKMQQIKARIYQASSAEEVMGIEIFNPDSD